MSQGVHSLVVVAGVLWSMGVWGIVGPPCQGWRCPPYADLPRIGGNSVIERKKTASAEDFQ